MSLVVRQTKPGHAEVAALRQQLRQQLKDLVALESVSVVFDQQPTDLTFEWAGSATSPKNAVKYAVLTSDAAESLLKTAQTHPHAHVSPAPKVFLSSGRMHHLCGRMFNKTFAGDQNWGVVINPLTSPQRDAVELRLALENLVDSGEDNAPAAATRIPAGRSLLVDVTRNVQSADTSSGNVPDSAERHFLILTLRIMVTKGAKEVSNWEPLTK